MSLKTRYNLFKIRRSMTPGGHFKADLSKKLSAVWDNTYNIKYTWYQTAWFKHATGFALVVLIAGSLGTGAYAYTSPAVTEGSVLYPIKDKLESIEEIAQITPEAKAKFYLKKIERREVEREVLKEKELPLEISVTTTEAAKKGEVPGVKEKIKIKDAERKIEKTEKLIERAEDQLEKVGDVMEKINSKDIKLREKVRERLKVRLEKRQDRLDKHI